MLLRHHEKTQELEYRQQKAVHQLREEQVQRQHDTELHNQREYMQRAQRELRKKHALQLKQQPKSLKVYFVFIFNRKILLIIFVHLLVLLFPTSSLHSVFVNRHIRIIGGRVYVYNSLEGFVDDGDSDCECASISLL